MVEQHLIPEFMQEYYKNSNSAARHQIEKLAGNYSEERAVFLQTVFVSKQEFLRDWNRKTGQRQQLTAEEALAPMRHKYAEQARQIAMEQSHQEQDTQPEEEQPSLALKADRETFLSNLQSMRERQASQQARPRY